MLAASIITNPQLMLVAGFMLLGWVLVRRQIASRQRLRSDARTAQSASVEVAAQSTRSLPLADAPLETQRWQVAMFDLQRELKADLDTRIAVVQSLLRRVDERIVHLERLENKP